MAFSTTTQGDRIETGQDFDRRVGTADNRLGDKRLTTRARTERTIDVLGIPTPQAETVGPEIGWHFYSPTSIGITPPVWAEAFPVISRKAPGAGAGLEYRLVGPDTWEDADERWTVPEGAIPEGIKYPGGWVFASLRTTEENAQNTAFLPGFVGLVAPHFAGDEDFGTPVYDLDADNALDRARKAPLQSLCRVYAYPDSQCVDFGEGHGLALQLGISREDRAGFGMVADEPVAGQAANVIGAGPTVARGLIPQILAALSVNRGGFIDVGDANDVHQLGVNADGETCNGAHVSERTNYRGRTGDAPKEYDPRPWVEPAQPPYLTRTFHRLDPNAEHEWTCGTRKGLRKWEGLSYFRIKDGADPPPIEDPPPGGEGGDGIDYVVGRTRRELDLATTELELGTVALVGVPQHTGGGKRDLRNATGPGARGAFAQAVASRELVRPSVGRFEWGGLEDGGVWALTNQPGASVYRDGDAQGFGAFMPANYSLGYEAPPVNPGFQVILWDSDLAWGTPSTTVGGVVSGFARRLSGGDLKTYSVDSAGVDTEVMALTSSGNLTVSGAVLAAEHINVEVAGAGGTTTGVSFRAYLVDLSSSGQEVTLPEIGVDAEDGDIVVVKDRKGDAATNNLTVTCNGTDTIEDGGSASETINVDYSSRRYVAVVGASSNYWAKM